MLVNGQQSAPSADAVDNRLLVIDDEIDIASYIADVGEMLGFASVATTSAAEFKSLISDFRPTVIVVDLIMPQADGIELLRYLAERSCDASVMVASGMDTRVLGTAMRLGEEQGLRMLGSLQKPISMEALEGRLLQAVRRPWSPQAEELSHAIKSGQLTVHFQPKVSFVPGGPCVIRDCEALVRWNHPERGMVPPVAFIPLAEQTGLIGPLTDCVLSETIAQISSWRQRGLDMTVAVNIAANLLDDLTLPDRIDANLRAKGLTSDALVLEITESAIMSHMASAMDILTRMRVKGYGLSIDDFGTGYSSFVQLYRMPFNEMKIDRSFVMDIGKTDEAAIIVRSITELAHNLGLSVCAEGIETKAAYDFLSTIGCDKAQGYFVCKPCPAKEFSTFVENWNAKANSLVTTSATT